jgi:hypothetical protein
MSEKTKNKKQKKKTKNKKQKTKNPKTKKPNKKEKEKQFKGILLKRLKFNHYLNNIVIIACKVRSAIYLQYEFYY